MNDDRSLVSLIERTLDDHPVCGACGSHTDVREADGALWLVCAKPSSEGRVGRFFHNLLGHERRQLISF